MDYKEEIKKLLNSQEKQSALLNKKVEVDKKYRNCKEAIRLMYMNMWKAASETKDESGKIKYTNDKLREAETERIIREESSAYAINQCDYAYYKDLENKLEDELNKLTNDIWIGSEKLQTQKLYLQFLLEDFRKECASDKNVLAAL